MLRALLLIALGIGLFVGSSVAGFLVSSKLAPEWLRATTERRLASALGADVSIGRLRGSLRWGLVLHASDIEASWGPGGQKLTVPTAVGRIDPRSLLRARIALERLVLDRPVLARPFPAPLAAPDSSGGVSRLEQSAGALESLAKQLESPSLPARHFEVRNGRIDLFREGADPVVVKGLSAETHEHWFGRRRSLDLSASLESRGVNGGEVEIRAEASDTLDAAAVVSNLDLALLAATSQSSELRDAAGRADLQAHWTRSHGEPHHVSVEGSGRDLWLDFAGSTLPLDMNRAELTAELEIGDGSLALLSGRISDGRVAVSARGTLGLPARPTARVELNLATREILLEDLDGLAAQLPELPARRLRDFLGWIQAGRIIHGSLALDTDQQGWSEIWGGAFLKRAGDLRIRLALADATVRIGSDSLESVRGVARWDGQELELTGFSAQFLGDPLPDLEATLRGLQDFRTSDAFHCVRPRSVGSLPGRRALSEWVGSRRVDSESWQRIAIEADWILHPGLGCSLERVRAEVTPSPDGIRVVLEHGVWAAMPVSAEAIYRRSPRESISLRVDLGPPWEPVGPYPADAPWALGRFHAEASAMGRWKIRGANGGFSARGDTVSLEAVRIALDPGGEVEATLEIDLDRDDHLPYRAHLQIPAVQIADLEASAGVGAGDMTGTLIGAGVLKGEMHPSRSMLTDAEGVFSLHARDGSVRQVLPVFFAIAGASPRHSPFASRKQLEFEALDAMLRIQDGRIRGQNALLETETLRVLASGEVGAAEPFEIEAVVGVFFFPTLDNVLQRLPLLNRVMLGSDQNLVGAYFAVTGPWRKPDASLVPMKSLVASPAGFILRGFPSFVRGGIRRIQSVFLGTPAHAVPLHRADS